MTARFRVVITDQIFPTIDIEREILAGIDADLEVASGSRDDVLRIAADADALLNTYFSFDAEALGRLRRCRIVARYGIGVDNIDLDAARERGIVVTNVPDYCVEEVAAHAVAVVLSLLRRLPEGKAVLERGGWASTSSARSRGCPRPLSVSWTWVASVVRSPAFSEPSVPGWSGTTPTSPTYPGSS